MKSICICARNLTVVKGESRLAVISLFRLIPPGWGRTRICTADGWGMGTSFQ